MQPDALGTDQDALGTLMMQNPELLIQLAAMDPAFAPAPPAGLPGHPPRPAEVRSLTCPSGRAPAHTSTAAPYFCWSRISPRDPELHLLCRGTLLIHDWWCILIAGFVPCAVCCCDRAEVQACFPAACPATCGRAAEDRRPHDHDRHSRGAVQGACTGACALHGAGR